MNDRKLDGENQFDICPIWSLVLIGRIFVKNDSMLVINFF